MQKLIITSVLLSAALFVKAQTFDQLFQKYEGKEGVTTVEVTQKLFALAASAMPVQDDELKNFITELKGIKIICFENEAASSMNGKMMYKEFEAALPEGLDELMTINSDGENVRFMGRVTKENIVDEMILLVDDGEAFAMLQILGTLDFTKVSKLGDMHLDIEGLDELDKLEQIENK
jgi:hypothetical protein